jgi:hypothetical protein
VTGRSARPVAFSTIRREQVEWLVPERVPLGMLTLLIGDPGLGKSLFTCMVAAQLSRAELLNREPAATLLLTAEDSLGATIRPRLDAAGARLDLVSGYELRTPEGIDEGGLVIPDDLEQLEELVARSEARCVVIDPLGAHLPSTINAWQDQSVRRALAPLARLAETYGCAVIAVLHLNKRDSTNALRRINGSVGFGAAARSVLLFARDPDDPDGESGRRRVLSHEKCNVGPEVRSLLYELEPILLPAVGDEPEARSARLRYLGETTRNGGDLLGRDFDHERSALEEAKDFLVQELGLGPRPAKDIRAAAAAIGIAPKTLERARYEVCHKPRKLGFSGGWEWALKQQSLFVPEDRQTAWPPSETIEVDDLRGDQSKDWPSDASEDAESPEDRHSGDMAIFEDPDAEREFLELFPNARLVA